MKLNLDTVMCPRCNGPVIRPFGSPHPEPPESPAGARLTRRERVVYRLLCNGMTNKQIANQLVISENTVRFHLKGLYSKLRVRSRLHAVALGGGIAFDRALTA